MNWPVKIPYCNPIENVWGLLKNRLCKKRYKSIRIFIKQFRKEWDNISREYAVKLVESCDKRCVVVIQNKVDCKNLLNNFEILFGSTFLKTELKFKIKILFL